MPDKEIKIDGDISGFESALDRLTQKALKLQKDVENAGNKITKDVLKQIQDIDKESGRLSRDSKSSYRKERITNEQDYIKNVENNPTKDERIFRTDKAIKNQDSRLKVEIEQSQIEDLKRKLQEIKDAEEDSGGSQQGFLAGALQFLAGGAMLSLLKKVWNMTKGETNALEIGGGRLAGLGVNDGSSIGVTNARINNMRGFGYKPFGFDSATLGVSQSQFMKLASDLAISQGSIKGLETQTLRNLTLEKAYGLNSGTLTNSSKYLRSDDSKSAADNVQEMLNIFRRTKLFNIDKGDFTQLSEKIEMQNALVAAQGDRMDKVDATRASQILAAFGSIKDVKAFQDQRLSGIIKSFDEKLKGGGSEIENAIQLRTLRELHPEASMSEIFLKYQRGGINTPGYLPKYLQNIKNISGGNNDLALMNIANTGNLDYDQAKGIMGQGSNSAFAKFMNSSGGKTGTQKIDQQRAIDNTGFIAVLDANLNNTLGKVGSELSIPAKKVYDKMGELIKTIETLVKKMSN